MGFRLLLSATIGLLVGGLFSDNSLAQTSLPFKAGQTWEMVGTTQGGTVEERFLVTIKNPRSQGNIVQFETERNPVVISNKRFVPYGLFFDAQFSHVIVGFLSPDDASKVASDEVEGRHCWITSTTQGPRFEGYYHGGKMKEFGEVFNSNATSNLGKCTLRLK